MAPSETMQNIDHKVVEGFGREWAAFDQIELDHTEFEHRFETYFHIFPFQKLPGHAEGFDLGCGSGRWAAGVVAHPRVGKLHCIDPSLTALSVAQKRLQGNPKAVFHVASSETIPLADESQDFGYSLGVLHHIPDPEGAMRDCIRKLKPGAPFLVYLYYNFDNKPVWFRWVWKASDVIRWFTCRLPFTARKLISNVIAGTIYWPLTRIAKWAERAGADVHAFPLAPYRNYTFYTMRTDALDRFGTRLEHRFSRGQVLEMMERCGLRDVEFSDDVPFWTAYGIKTSQ